MALPDNFNASEHLQSTIRIVYNKIINKHFDVPGDQEPDISTPDSSLEVACRMTDNDSWPMMQARMSLYYMVLGNWDEVMGAMYSIPCSTYHEAVTFKPQISLIFYESKVDADSANRQRVRAEISFRLPEKDTELTNADVERYTNRIKQIFSTPQFFFKKGTKKYSYRDDSKGYNFIIAAFDEANAKKLINAVLDIQNHTPDYDAYMTVSSTDKNYAAIENKTILGKVQRMPRKRPIATVFFYRAELKIYGVEDRILWTDRLR